MRPWSGESLFARSTPRGMVEFRVIGIVEVEGKEYAAVDVGETIPHLWLVAGEAPITEEPA